MQAHREAYWKSLRILSCRRSRHHTCGRRSICSCCWQRCFPALRNSMCPSPPISGHYLSKTAMSIQNRSVWYSSFHPGEYFGAWCRDGGSLSCGCSLRRRGFGRHSVGFVARSNIDFQASSYLKIGLTASFTYPILSAFEMQFLIVPSNLAIHCQFRSLDWSSNCLLGPLEASATTISPEAEKSAMLRSNAWYRHVDNIQVSYASFHRLHRQLFQKAAQY